MSFEVSPNALARCAAHPEELAGSTCHRCGTFVCGTCSTWVMGALYCPGCAARPEVNYLETFRRQRWGKRDVGAWLVGGGTLVLAWLGVVAFGKGQVPLTLGLVGAVIVGLGWFGGQRWARVPLLLTPLAAGLLATPSLGVLALAFGLIFFFSALQLFLDTRGKLFFRVAVPERELHRLWNREVNNPLAQSALTLGVGAIFLPLFAPLAILCGVLALRRVDLKARPPIGRRGHALAGIGLGVGAVALWGVVVIPLLQRGFREFAGF
jgi:hypothetical protein